MRSFDVFFVVNQNKLLNSRDTSETTWRSFGVTVIMNIFMCACKNAMQESWDSFVRVK